MNRAGVALADGGEAAPGRLAETLARSPVLGRCSPQEVARLLPFLRERRLQPGEPLCRAGEPARDTWVVLRGTLRLTRADRTPHDVTEGLVGEEAALGIDCYLADVVAIDHAVVAALDRRVAPATLTAHSDRAHAFGRSLIRVFAPRPVADQPAAARDDRLTAPIAAWKLLGWAGAVVSPVLLLRAFEGGGLRWEQQQLAAVLASTACLWTFGAVPPYVAGLLVVLTCVTLGLVPTTVVLSGFASNGFFLALSIFSLGAVLIDSGVITRAWRAAMKRVPVSAVWYDLAALAAGAYLTPIVPSAQDRARVLAPLATEIAQTLGYPAGSRERTRLTLATFMGLALFGPMFLTGGTLNLVLFGSLPEQVQDAVPWLRWASAALAAMLVLLAAFLGVYLLAFRDAAPPRPPRATLDAQLGVMGPMRAAEWLAVGGMLIFLGAAATVSLHKIDHRLLALTVVCGYLVLGFIGREQLNLRIDWSALMLLGGLIGAIATIVHVDLHAAIGSRLVELSDIMKYRPRLFVAMLAATVAVAGLVIPMAGALVALFAIPLAIFNGMSPWVVVFVILLMSDLWIWPRQSDVYRTYRDIVTSHGAIEERRFLRFNAAMAAARVAALAASVAYWEHLRVL